MKLQIDTTNKTITLSDTVSIGEFVEKLEAFLPGEWKSFKLHVDPKLKFVNPIIIREHYPYRYPWFSGYPHIRFVGNNTGTGGAIYRNESTAIPSLQAGKFQVEV